MQKQIEFKILTQLVSEQRGKCSSVFSISSKEVYDENILRQMAYANKVENCLYKACKKDPLLLSQKSFTALKSNVAVALSKRTAMQQSWRIIEEAFAKEGINPLIIKGPASSLQLYGNPITREYTDIDLVIAPNQFYQALKIMESIGYCEKSGLSYLPDSRDLSKEYFLVQKIHHLVFTSSQSPFRIELHNAFFSGVNNSKYTTERVIGRGVKLVYQGVTYHAPSIIDHVLLLIIHGSKHAWSQLHWLIDIVAVLSIEDDSLHYDICNGIEDLGLQKHTALMIALIKDLFSIEIPQPYIKFSMCFQNDIKKQLDIAINKLTSMSVSNPSIWDIISFSWFYLLPLAGTRKEKLKILINPFLISPQDSRKLKLPKSMMWIHLILRPFFVIGRRHNRRQRRK
jgi:hypothetical protein